LQVPSKSGGGQPHCAVYAIQERAVCENPGAGPDGIGCRGDGAAYTLEARQNVQAVAFAQNQRGELRTSDVSPQITCGGGKPGEGYPAIAFKPGSSPEGRSIGAQEEVACTLESGGGGNNRQAIAFPTEMSATQCASPEERDPALSVGHTTSVAFQERGRDGGRNVEWQEDVAYSLNAPSGGGRAQERNIATGWAVRRLTPTECERLQGFPDGFTAIPWRGKPADQCPDGPRYKALGNSMAVNVMCWIGERIEAVRMIGDTSNG
jgi:site-specific DNA-cytosine methylase